MVTDQDSKARLVGQSSSSRKTLTVSLQYDFEQTAPLINELTESEPVYVRVK